MHFLACAKFSVILLFEVKLGHFEFADESVGLSNEVEALDSVVLSHHGSLTFEGFVDVFDGFVVEFQLHRHHADILKQREDERLLILLLLFRLHVTRFEITGYHEKGRASVNR